MLHIVNKSPMERNTLSTCLATAQSGTVLLIEDAVYAATSGHPAAAQLTEARQRGLKIAVLIPDLEARGLADRMAEGISPVDYAGFVDLAAQEPSCQSWL